VETAQFSTQDRQSHEFAIGYVICLIAAQNGHVFCAGSTGKILRASGVKSDRKSNCSTVIPAHLSTLLFHRKSHVVTAALSGT
jgi:hypothetical protein